VVVDMRPAGSPGQKCKRVEGREGAGRRVSSEEVVWRADCAVLTRALGRCRVWAVECEGGTLSATGDRADRRKESVEPGAWVQTARTRRMSFVGIGGVCVCGMHDNQVGGGRMMLGEVREHCCYYRSRGRGGRTGKARPHWQDRQLVEWRSCPSGCARNGNNKVTPSVQRSRGDAGTGRRWQGERATACLTNTT
jgi:hypothetical protein